MEKPKSITTISIESSLFAQAKASKINMSALCEQALRSVLNSQESPRVTELKTQRKAHENALIEIDMQLQAVLEMEITRQKQLSKIQSHPMLFEYKRQYQQARDLGEGIQFLKTLASKLGVDQYLLQEQFDGE